jgi:flagellar basal-body rod modification protein FlgD
MLSIKSGTQAWSKSPQQVDFARDESRTMSATDQEKALGDQDVGAVLNKIADPNWVDPSKALRKVGDAALDKDSFMKLLLTQMKHQDPTNPLQSHEMAAQLAQFTSLEKLTNINDSIAALTKAQAPTQNFEALNLIGKAVAADSGKIDRLDESDSHPIAFQLSGDAPQAEIQISDAQGNVVRKLSTTNLKAGRNEIVWNGKTEEGRDAPKGAYTAAVNAKASNGSRLFADTKVEGIISGVNFTPQGAMVMIGRQSVPLKDIKQIVDPRFMQQQATQQLQAKPPSATGTTPAHPTTKPEEGKPAVVASNLSAVGMSQSLINQLNKSGAKAGGY